MTGPPRTSGCRWYVACVGDHIRTVSREPAERLCHVATATEGAHAGWAVYDAPAESFAGGQLDRSCGDLGQGRGGFAADGHLQVKAAATAIRTILMTLLHYGSLVDNRHRMHRERLRNDLAVLDDESVGAQGDISAYAPGDIGDVPVDQQAPERETVNGLGRQGCDEVLEESVDFLFPTIDLGFGVEMRVIVVVTHYRANGMLLKECLQVVTNNGFCDS
jgi:hypothetical protein